MCSNIFDKEIKGNAFSKTFQFIEIGVQPCTLKKGCASAKEVNKFFGTHDLYVIYKDTYNDIEDYIESHKTTIKRYDIELQPGLKKKKSFFIEPGVFKSYDYLNRMKERDTFKSISGRETFENIPRDEVKEEPLFKGYIFINDQKYFVTKKADLIIDVVSDFGGLFLSLHGSLFVVSIMFTRFNFFRKVLGELYLIKKHYTEGHGEWKDPRIKYSIDEPKKKNNWASRPGYLRFINAKE